MLLRFGPKQPCCALYIVIAGGFLAYWQRGAQRLSVFRCQSWRGAALDDVEVREHKQRRIAPRRRRHGALRVRRRRLVTRLGIRASCCLKMPDDMARAAAMRRRHFPAPPDLRFHRQLDYFAIFIQKDAASPDAPRLIADYAMMISAITAGRVIAGRESARRHGPEGKMI